MNLSQYEPLDPDMACGARQQRCDAGGKPLPADDQSAVLLLTPGNRPRGLDPRHGDLDGSATRSRGVPDAFWELRPDALGAEVLAPVVRLIPLVGDADLRPFAGCPRWPGGGGARPAEAGRERTRSPLHRSCGWPGPGPPRRCDGGGGDLYPGGSRPRPHCRLCQGEQAPSTAPDCPCISPGSSASPRSRAGIAAGGPSAGQRCCHRWAALFEAHGDPRGRSSQRPPAQPGEHRMHDLANGGRRQATPPFCWCRGQEVGKEVPRQVMQARESAGHQALPSCFRAFCQSSQVRGIASWKNVPSNFSTKCTMPSDSSTIHFILNNRLSPGSNDTFSPRQAPSQGHGRRSNRGISDAPRHASEGRCLHPKPSPLHLSGPLPRRAQTTIDRPIDAIRARTLERLPAALTIEEVVKVIGYVSDPYELLAK
jgi:hypothetical protein